MRKFQMSNIREYGRARIANQTEYKITEWSVKDREGMLEKGRHIYALFNMRVKPYTNRLKPTF